MVEQIAQFIIKGEIMLYVIAALAVAFVCIWYAGKLHGMSVMADQIEDRADEDANPDANE